MVRRSLASKRAVSRAAIAVVLTAVTVPNAFAHVVCGDRVFPPTLVIDDPGINDEASLPTIQYTPIPASNGSPKGTLVSYGYEWDKTITQDFGFAVNGDYITRYGAGETVTGWDNTTLTLKTQLPCSEANEFVVSVGVIREFAKSGSQRLVNTGVIDSVSNTAPTFYAGKGLGDLPIGYLRPLALTAEVGYQVSDQYHAQPNEWDYGFSVQYSVPYLNQHVEAQDVPEFFTHLLPLVEFSFSSPARNFTTGTVSPGILYEADAWQVGIEAVIPVNRATRQSQGDGFIAQFHLFLDDIFPDTIGKPLIDTNLWK